MSPKMKMLCSYIFPAVGSGFTREFWVADEYKNQAHGSALLALAEEHFLKNGIYTSILTTDTISGFLS